MHVTGALRIKWLLRQLLVGRVPNKIARLYVISVIATVFVAIVHDAYHDT